MIFRYNDYLFESSISRENFQEDRMKAYDLNVWLTVPLHGIV